MFLYHFFAIEEVVVLLVPKFTEAAIAIPEATASPPPWLGWLCGATGAGAGTRAGSLPPAAVVLAAPAATALAAARRYRLQRRLARRRQPSC